MHAGISYDEEKETLLINGVEINLNKKYSVAIPDMLTFGKFFPAINECKQKKYYLPELGFTTVETSELLWLIHTIFLPSS